MSKTTDTPEAKPEPPKAKAEVKAPAPVTVQVAGVGALAVPPPVAGRPAPDFTPTAPEAHAAERPVAAEWIRLRTGCDQVSIRCFDDVAKAERTIRLYGGVRYPMPVGCEYGRPGKPHPMIVREKVQEGFPAVDLATLDVSRWEFVRAAAQVPLEQAKALVERVRGRGALAECLSRGIPALLATANALRELDGKPPLSVAMLNPPFPPGLTAIDASEKAEDLDRAACGSCGEQQVSRESLARHLATTCKVRGRDKVSPETARVIDARVREAMAAGY